MELRRLSAVPAVCRIAVKGCVAVLPRRRRKASLAVLLGKKGPLLGSIFLLLASLLYPFCSGAQDVFGNIFGAGTASSQTQLSSTGSQTGGQETIATPPAIQGNRTVQLDKDGRATGILSFYLKTPARSNVKVSFDFGPWARYGFVKEVFVRDVNGNVSGGKVEQDDKDIRISKPYRLYVEKLNPNYGTWERFADHPAHSGGRISFPVEGYYRLTVLPNEQTVYSLSPQSATVLVLDPALNRDGQTIYHRIFVNPPRGSGSGTAISVNGNDFPKRDYGQGFERRCPSYAFSATAARGIVKTETDMTRQMKSTEEPRPYGQGSWVLRAYEGKAGSTTLKTQKGGETFTFDANYWGDGRYELEVHLAEQHQAQGLQQLSVPPGSMGITVSNCGAGSYKPPEPELKTFEGEKKKKCEVVVGASDEQGAAANQPDKTICIEANAFQQKAMAQLNNQNELKFVDQPAPVDIVRHDVPKDTPDVPVQISNDCPDLLRQIAARETQITIPCDEPVDLMRHLLQLPKMYEDYQSRFADQWEKALRDVQGFYNSVPIIKLVQEYQQLVKTAYANDLIMSEADRQRYDSYRMGETGIPLSLGNGIAPTAAVFDTGKVALLNQLRAEQQRIYTEYGNARRKLEADIQGLKVTVEQHNKVLETRYGELVQIRAALGKGQNALNNMYNSGTFEHCLGMGLKTSANYTITFDDGRQQQGAAWALPGMNLILPEPKKQQIPLDGLTVPDKLPDPLRFKVDGIRQAQQDRKTAEALAEAARVAFEVENGSWLNWAGSWCSWLLQPTGIDTVLESIAAGNSVADSLSAAGVALYDRYGAVVGGVASGVGGVYDSIVNRPMVEVMAQMDAISNVLNPGKLVPAVFEGLGDDVAKFIRSKEVLKEIESLMDEQARLGTSPQANVRALEIANRINALWKEMEAGSKAMNNIIMTIATSTTVLKGAEAIAGTKPLAALQGYIDDVARQLSASQKASSATASAIVQRAELEANIARLEAARESGQVLGSQVDEALAAAREALKRTGGSLDDAIAANQQAVKQLSDKLDEAVKTRQAQLEALARPSAAPASVVTVAPESISGGNILGTGAAGQVKDVGDGAIAKVFKNKELFDDELAGLKNLSDAGIAHVPATQAGLVNLGDSVVTNNKNVIIKPKFTETQVPLQDVLDSRAGTGRVLTRQEQIEALEFYSNAAKKGIVFGDPNSGNLLKETLPDGSFRYLAVEGGSIAKVDPDQARTMMKAIFDPSLVPDNANVMNKGIALSEAFAGAGAEEIAGKFFNTGFSMADGNIAKHIDPDLLKKFLTSSPAEWDELVNGARRAQVLADDAIKKLQNTVDNTAAAVSSASNELSSNVAGLQQQIDNAAAPVSQGVQSGSVMGGGGQPVLPVTPSIGPQSLIPRSKLPEWQYLEVAA